MSFMNPKLKLYCDEKIKLFRANKMWDAPKAEIIGVLTDYKLVTTELNCGGWHNKRTKEIALSPYNDPKFELSVLFHEMGHAFNTELEKYEKEQWLLSWKLRDEIETDFISKYMLDNLYPNTVPDDQVITYQWDEDNAQFLKDWYGDWVEDDLLTI